MSEDEKKAEWDELDIMTGEMWIIYVHGVMEHVFLSSCFAQYLPC